MVLLILQQTLVCMTDTQMDGRTDRWMDKPLKKRLVFTPPVACTLEGQVVSHTSVP